MKKKKHIICCGESLFDLIVKKNEKTGDLVLEAHAGGSATNTAIILAHLGLPSVLISRLGVGSMSSALVEILSKQGVETSHIIRDKRVHAPLAFAHVDKKGNSTYQFYEYDAPYKKPGKTKLKALFRDTAVLHTGSFFSYSDRFFPLIRDLLKLAKEEDVFVTYDPNWRAPKIPDKRNARSRIKKILPFVDLLKLSETDAVCVTGAKSLDGAIKRIEQYLKGGLIVTLGEKGSFYWDGKKKLRQSAFRVRVVDTIGAGDSFTAGLIHRYCSAGKDVFWEEMKENLRYASALSSLSCTGRGATEGLKDPRRARKFL